VWRGCHGDSSLGIPGEKKKKINKNAKCTSKTNTSSGLLSSYCNLKCAILKQLIV